MTWQALLNKTAPTFTIPDSNGQPFTVEGGKDGRPVALFFYPKSGSYGCTKEACQFRDAIADKPNFNPEKLRVIGLSQDSVEKQKQFVEKQKLTYPILSDEKGEARKAYHVGRGLMGLTDARVTFIIDSKGIIRDAFDSVMSFNAHCKFIEKWLEKLEKEKKEGEALTSPATAGAPAEAAATPAPESEAPESEAPESKVAGTPADGA
ncbi:alkyl hydroperoxide reductase thiol specific antioxidant mal allergen [Moniliophthora roreri MCA 2997]|uniref:thioredoxin-dependent peroxiredoxin n=2 Tax=Moniliophthora roreri TaxID=221103 RepID=V2XR11_MONRO|nr:alkyl hydroperoxide reductase thiol specific antioxidant mal allergen [Moniliophthora roreri MCA 2997]